MSFKTICKTSSSTARLGSLKIGNKIVSTPNLVIKTSRACVPHLTPDTFKRTLDEDDYAGMLVNLEFLIEDGCILPKSSPHPLDKLMGYTGVPMILATNDSDYYEGRYFEDDKEQERIGFGINNGADWISVCNSGGVSNFNISNSLKVIIEKLQPTAIISPTDHYVMKQSRLKKMIKSTDTSSKYFNLVELAVKDTDSLLIPSLTLHPCNQESNEKQTFVNNELARRTQMLLAQATDKPIISLIHQNDDISLPTISSSAIFKRGAINPLELKRYVEQGADLFESTFATDMADKGHAINIVDLSTGEYSSFNLNDSNYFKDFTVISDDCHCVACQGTDKTTRSYIHHLLATKEMLAHVYLASHNIWQLANFLKSLRKTIPSLPTDNSNDQ